jgi:hypothetical protein
MPSELSQTDAKIISKNHILYFSQIFSTEILNYMTYHKQCCGGPVLLSSSGCGSSKFWNRVPDQTYIFSELWINNTQIIYQLTQIFFCPAKKNL